MTPDGLHYWFVVTGWIAVGGFGAAALLVHKRLRSFWSGLLLAGIAIVALGHAGQQLAPADDMPLEEFEGIVVTSGRLPLVWYAGSLAAAVGWLIAAAGALGVAWRLAPETHPKSDRQGGPHGPE